MENELDTKILKAVHRIEDLYFQTKGNCYISFSGGKDSTVLLELIKMSIDSYVLPKQGIKAVFIDTGVEMQATIDFVKWCKESGYYKNIEIIRPQTPYAIVLQKYGKPMKSKMKSEFINRWQNGSRSESTMDYLVYGKNPNTGKQFSRTKLADKDFHMLHPCFEIKASQKCCDYMKKKPAKYYEQKNNIDGKIVGIRAGEGGARQMALMKRMKNGGKLCTYYNGKTLVKAPIIDWTDDDIEKFVKKYNVPLSKAYTEYGMTRTGCYGCPYSLDLKSNLKILYDYEPNRYKSAMFFLKDVYIAQNVKLPFDTEYEREREHKWKTEYLQMRNEMLKEYRPKSSILKKYGNIQFDIFEFLEEENLKVENVEFERMDD